MTGPLLFSNWALLAGLLALALPIIIHLLLKQRPKRMRFSTLRFFIEQDETSRRRRRLRHLLLLSFRLLLLALLVLGFARPYFVEPAAMGSETGGRLLVLVLDRSASMQAAGRWERAIRVSREALDALSENDLAAMVVCGARAEVLSAPVSPSKLKPMLDSLQPGHGSALLAEGLSEAAALIAGQENSHWGRTEIVLMSDLQEHSLAGLENVRLPSAVDLRMARVAGSVPSNAGIVGLRSAAPGEVEVRLRNFSLYDSRPLTVWLHVNGGRSASVRWELDPKSETNLMVNLGSLPPGWHSVNARLEGEDTFAPDNARHLAVYVPPPRQVWCGEPRHARPGFEHKTFFVRSALSPDEAPGPYSVGVIPPGELAGRLKKESPDLLVLPGFIEVHPGLPAAVSNYVARGGGLLMFLDEDVRPDLYNIRWRGLLPAVLQRAEGELDRPELLWKLAMPRDEGLLFGAFDMKRELPRAVFKRRFGLALQGGTVLAEFDDGEPLVVASQIGLGTVLLVNTTANADWNDWPKRRTFVPWVYGMAATATGRAAWLGEQHDHAFPFADAIAVSPDAGGEEALALFTPDGQRSDVLPGPDGAFSIRPAAPGIYALGARDGTVAARFGVNVPAKESSETFVSAHVAQGMVRRDEAAREGVAGGLAAMGQKELWRIILGFGLAVLLAEFVLANRTWA